VDDSTLDPVMIHNLKDSTFNIDLTTTASLLTFKITLGNEIIQNYSVNINDIRNNPRFCPQSIWFVKEKLIVATPTPYVVNADDIVYALDNTFSNKRAQLRLNTDTTNYLPFDIFFSSESSDFSNCTIRFQGDDVNTLNFTLNGNAVQPSVLNSWKDMFSTITMTSSGNHVAGDPVTVTVNSSQTDLEYVILEQDVGLLDRTTVNLTNGVGQFNILTNSMNAGETSIVHAGFKRYTKAATFTTTLN
jgi:hypothetical protein